MIMDDFSGSVVGVNEYGENTKGIGNQPNYILMSQFRLVAFCCLLLFGCQSSNQDNNQLNRLETFGTPIGDVRPESKDVSDSLDGGFWIIAVASMAVLFLAYFLTQSKRSVNHGAHPIIDKTPTTHSRKQEQEQSIPLEELEKLAKMKEAGHITEEEFQELKRDLLKKTTSS
jgi:hypothetical protein